MNFGMIMIHECLILTAQIYNDYQKYTKKIDTSVNAILPHGLLVEGHIIVEYCV